MGLLWERFKSRFPRVEQQPRLPHVIERKGNPGPPALLPSIAILSATDLIPRVWMTSIDNTELIQVQTDRFLRNWRRYHNTAIPYPSYETFGRPGFVADFENFCAFARDQGLGDPEIDQCEMTYINHIRPCGVWSEFADLGKVFKVWGPSYPSLGGSKADTIGCRVRHELADDEGRFIGHLFVEADSGYLTAPDAANDDLTPVLQFQLIVRGRPLGDGTAGVMEFMDFAHRVIVKSFTEVTTTEMHTVWERIQ
jgi:uncharacterized protein (TIGR04255 family)